MHRTRPLPTHSDSDKLFPFDEACWTRIVKRLQLAPRHAQIVERIIRGESDKEIAEGLGLHIGTLRSYINRIFERLGVRRREQIIARVFTVDRELFLEDQRRVA